VARDLSKFRINLEKAVVLIIDENASGLGLLSTIISGFGIGERIRAASAADAIDIVKARTVDLILVEAAMSRMDGYDFIHWLRRSGLKPNAYAPTILVTGHTPRDKVEKARDCGANYIVTKPLTPLTLIERVIFVSRDPRPFVECDSYIGPDRRFKNTGPPAGTNGRRKTDSQDELGEATAPNMSQTDIDALLKPTKARP
jgi:CheY-like chemotaxis protein